MSNDVTASLDLYESQKLLNTIVSKVKGILRNPGDVDKILLQLEEKLKTVPTAGTVLADVPLMISMVKAWIKKEYTVVSPKVVACLVGAALYIVKRNDVIPDSWPLVGIIDDLAVLGLVLKFSEPELKAFADWRDAQSKQPETRQPAAAEAAPAPAPEAQN